MERVPMRAATIRSRLMLEVASELVGDREGWPQKQAMINLREQGDEAERHYPLRVSLRGQRDHSVHMVTNVVLSTLGISLDDITAWGGEVRYDDGLPYTDARMGAARRGEVDAIFDEAMPSFADDAL